MQYLLNQMLMCLLAAGLLGVVIGWIWWGMRLRQARERTADFEQRASKLSGYPARLTDLEATHAAYVASKNEEEAKFKARIAELEPLTAKVQSLEADQKARAAEITTKGADLALLKTKFTDLETQHKAALETVKTGGARAVELEGLLKSKDGQIAEHVQSHQEKDARLKSLSARVAELEPVAKKVPLLEEQIAHHVDANKEKDEHLEQLLGQADELKAQQTAKDAQIGTLTTHLEQRTAALAEQDLHIEDLVAQVDQHVAANADLSSQLQTHVVKIAELTPLAVKAAKGHTEEHVAELAAAAALLPALQAAHTAHEAKIEELAPLAAMVPHLNSQIAELNSVVDQYAAVHADKDARISNLSSQVEEQSAKLAELAAASSSVPALQAAHAEKEAKIAELAPLAAMVPHLNSHIAELNSVMDQYTAAHADKDAQISNLSSQVEKHSAKLTELAPLAAMVPHLNSHIAELTTQAETKDTHIGALLSRVEELQPLAGSHSDLQYEHQLATRKLQMAERGLLAHQEEIAKLNDQLLTQKAELQQPAAAATVAPALTMATAAGAGSVAALGFYDVTEGRPATPPAAVQNHAAEFEKRIEELRSMEAAKDVEISALRGKIAEIEAAPDPDARRQILFTAKNAELTSLKGVLNSLLQPVNQDDIALRAYNYAKERGFNGGSESEDWLRAERDVHYARLASAWETTRGGGTMY